MANAAVDKLKTFGLRHGEKAVVGLISVLCVVLIAMAFSKPSLDVTPDDLRSATSSANANISKQPTQQAVLDKLETDGITDVEFLKVVEQRKQVTATAEPYRLANSLTAPEPGAGMIRDAVELLAPTNLVAHANRGSAMFYATDEEGYRIFKSPEEIAKEAEKKVATKKSRAGSVSGYDGMGGFGGTAKGSALDEEKAKRAAAEEAKRKQASLAGGAAKAKAKEEEAAPDQGEPVMELRGLRLVSIIGEFDHKTQRDNFSRALKVPFESAHPNYLRLDIQRQVMNDDGTWPEEWEDVDRTKNEDYLANFAENDKELVDPQFIVGGLVSPLPTFRSGFWQAVHYGPMVDAEVIQPKTPAAGMPGMMSGDSGMEAMMEGMPGGSDMESMMEGMSGGSGMPGMMGSGGSSGDIYAGPGEEAVPKSDAESVMVRSLDFTVAPDTTYRFRLRVVVSNPSYRSESVAPGVDNTSEELTGPWSEPTDPVSVPADVSTYALSEPPADADPLGEKLEFRVATFNPDDGVTVVRNYTHGPGEIIGKGERIQLPTAEGADKTKLTSVDFTSRQVLLDTLGGDRNLAKLNLGTIFDAPSRAIVIRPDGKLALRDEARDADQGEMDELKKIWDETRKEMEEGRKKPTSVGSSIEGMMGGGMMGGGMMGRGRGRGR